MFYRIRQKAHRIWFNTLCRDILSTPPIQCCKEDLLMIVSQVCHADIIMYLAAIKSFYYFNKAGQVCIINDGSLTSRDMQILRHHIRPLETVNIEQVKANVPIGGTWERLVAISEFVEDRYVIQIDSDTITNGEIPEVIECVNDGTSFLLGTSDGRSIQTMQTSCEAMSANKGLHVQTQAERNFDKLTKYENLNYVRGCSGFAGYAKRSFNCKAVQELSLEMEHVVGAKKWSEWGSEQVMSNIILANSSKARVLPYPKYGQYNGERYIDRDRSFIHFIDTYRFRNGVYIKHANDFIKKTMPIK